MRIDKMQNVYSAQFVTNARALFALSLHFHSQGEHMKNPVSWFEIAVDDMARARAFYEAVFGAPLQDFALPDAEDEFAMFGTDYEQYGIGGMLYRAPKQSIMRGNGITLYFACEDCAEEAARAAAHGGKILQDKQEIGDGNGFCALILDTEGNRIGLHSQK